MESIDVLMTPQFVEFSSKIAEIFKRKDARTAELRTIQEKYAKLFEALDEEAKAAQVEWENWKTSQTTSAE